MATGRKSFDCASPLGLAKLETTALYTRIAVNTVRDIKSPLDRLDLKLTKRTPPA